MPNYYTEHPELKFHLNNPMMERICQETKTSMTTRRKTMPTRWTHTTKCWKSPEKSPEK